MPLFQDQFPKTTKEKDCMNVIPYALIVGKLMCVMLCNKSNIYFAVVMVSRYQSNSRMKHLMTVKHTLKYIRRIRDYMLVYHCDKLLLFGYTNLGFQSDRDTHKFMFGFVFTLGGGLLVREV